ncbi:MAG: hypothetical protein JKY37_32090, partial [Nannocystaceae bacterium]|nr:hypothetical protein [Nannocystaceae bacterium]
MQRPTQTSTSQSTAWPRQPRREAGRFEAGRFEAGLLALSAIELPELAFASPRKLPRAGSLTGRVVVLDIAFAAVGLGKGFGKTTGKFIDALGGRLAQWVDHHDHPLHARYENDERFVLCTKAEHGACPEMITPALVQRAGPIDT